MVESVGCLWPGGSVYLCLRVDSLFLPIHILERNTESFGATRLFDSQPVLRPSVSGQGQYRPAGGTDGDELVLAVRETAFEIFLDGAAASLYVPRAVWLLVFE